jgi:hypothetical protein
MIRLSEHFNLNEFVASEIAARKGIDNSPPQEIIENLKRVAGLMEQVRIILCQPIYITSGYRCSALNKLVGSKPSSKHVQGLACDFKSPSFGDPLRIAEKLAKSDLNFDQLILEFYTPDGQGWVHLGLAASNRKQVLTINSHGTYAGLHP